MLKYQVGVINCLVVEEGRQQKISFRNGKEMVKKLFE